MARMIPPGVHAGCQSRGEIEVFHRLRDDPGTADWIVLHSLDIARHESQIAGEIDFVVLVPTLGVLCIEVKGCNRVEVCDGLWRYGSNPDGDPRGPFKQAASAMHSLRGELSKRRPALAGIPFWSVVIFPYLPFERDSTEWHTWQIIDNRSLRAFPISTLLSTVLDNARAFLAASPGAAWFHPGRREPTIQQCAELAAIMRPSFEYYESPKIRAQRVEADIKRYTEEQFEALDQMAANPRAVFAGPAGTGKTLLAIEAARRSRQAGRRVLLLCFNRFLGDWLQEQTEDLRPEVVTRTAHSHMVQVSGVTVSPAQARNSAFWRADLPLLAVNRLLDDSGGANLFDEIIVDEAQDLLDWESLDFLDVSLHGGLAAGRWLFFGDFEHQAIYTCAGANLQAFLSTRCPYVPVYRLRKNCRNTPRVADLARVLGGLDPFYSKILREDDGVDPNPMFYSDPDQQRQLLLNTLDKLRQEGFSNDEIVVLSPTAEGCCAATLPEGAWKQRLRPLREVRRGQTPYTTVHAFKGLESPAVIVTDITRLDEETRDLFYISVTRPLRRLFVFIHDSAKPDIINAMF